MLRASIATVAGLSILFALSQPAHGASIGVNFATNGSGTNLNLAPADVTGVVPQANWNNAQNTDPSLTNLVNDQGSGTSASMTWPHRPITTTSALPNNVPAFALLLAGIDLNSALTVAISNIPYAKYDLYLYFSNASQNLSGESYGLYFMNGQSIAGVVHTNMFSTTFVDATIPFGPGGNFLRAQNVTGSALTFGGVFDPGFIVPLDGFQIVEVPEPSTMVLAGLAATGLAVSSLRRRRQCRSLGHIVRDHR